MKRDIIKKSYLIKAAIYVSIVFLFLTLFIIYNNITPYNSGDGYINSNGITYVSTINEFEYQTVSLGNIIGKVDGTSFVYQIKNQDSKDYVIVKGFSTPPLVYRNKSLQAIDFTKLKISEINFIYKSGLFQKKTTTKDQAIIDDISYALNNPNSADKLPQSISDYYKLTLYSDDFKGIGYTINIKVDNNKKVYIDEIGYKGEALENILAGKNLSNWVNSIKK